MENGIIRKKVITKNHTNKFRNMDPRHCNYGIHLCKAHEKEHVREYISRSFDNNEPVHIYGLPPVRSFPLASDDPVPAKDYENLRKDYFILRLNYEAMLEALEEKGIVKVLWNSETPLN